MLRLLHSSTLSHNQIFVISHLSYKDAQVRAVSNFKIVALHYLKDPTGFPLDLVSVFHYMYELITLTIPARNPHCGGAVPVAAPRPEGLMDPGFFSREEKKMTALSTLKKKN